MGKSILIMVLGLFIIFGIANSSIFSILSQGSTSSISYFSDVRARDVSNSMARVILSRIADNPDLRGNSFSENILAGTADYSIIDTTIEGDAWIRIKVLGTYNQQKHTTTVIIPTRFTVVFGYAAWSQKDVKVKDGSTITTNFPGANANVYCGHKFEIDKKSNVDGFVYYRKSIKGAKENITPKINPLGLPAYVKTKPKMSPPEFDADAFKAQATEIYDGDLEIEDNKLTYGTKTNPAIVYVGGDLKFKKNVQVEGYVTFIVKKNIKFEKNVNVKSPDDLGTNIAFYASGKIGVKDNTHVEAQIYGEKGVKLDDNARVTGSVVAGGKKGKIELKKNSSIWYKPPTSSITGTFMGQGAYQQYGLGKFRVMFASWYEN